MDQVLIVHSDPTFGPALLPQLEEVGLVPTVTSNPDAALGRLFGEEPPDLLIVEITGEESLTLCEAVRRDAGFASISTLALLPVEDEGVALGIDWTDPPFDDYAVGAVEIPALVQRVCLNLARKRRHLDANPLTRLPGNNSIIQELERRMAVGEKFAVAYLDLDNFKAFNDKYGFSRGDEALRLTARLLMNLVGTGRGSFIGHVGGDDFVFIVPAHEAGGVAGRVVDHFDRIIASLYDEDDRARGAIVSTNRKGEVETFPLMSISIAVIPNRDGRLTHMGQVSAIAAELKKQAKSIDGSSVVIDRRRTCPDLDEASPQTGI